MVNVDLKLQKDVTHWTFDNSKRFEQKKWPVTFPVDQRPAQSKENYRYNDDLLIFNEVTESLEKIRLPVSLHGRDCLLRENIRFMHDQKSQCNGQEWLDELGNLTQWKVLSDSRFSSNMMVEHCAEYGSEFCIPFQVRVCPKVGNCMETNETALILESFQGVDVKFSFLHNFTNIKGATIEFKERVIDDAEDGTEQSLEVEFLPETRNDSFVLDTSGNVGYDHGKALLVSQFSTVNVSELQQAAVVIDFFRPGSNSTRIPNLTLPTVASNTQNCLKSTEPINFNENSITQCKLHLTEELPVDGGNFTNLCRKYQNEIFNLMYKTGNETTWNNFDVFVSQYGSPRNNTRHWVKLELINQFDYEKITGELLEETFHCRNMVLELGLKVYFARINDEKSRAKRQSLVQRVTIDLGSQLDLQFSVTEVIQVPVTMKVLFFDLTSGVDRNFILKQWIFAVVLMRILI